MDRKRTFITPRKNTFASDYINSKRAKVMFSGTSDLANTMIQQGGRLPVVGRSGYLKPYQGTYGFSSSTATQGAAPSSYCLNQARSYRDLLDITKGKYLLTPPNPRNTVININDVNFSADLFCGVLYKKGITGVVGESVIFNNALTGGATGPTGASNKIIYDPSTTANQWINVDPSFNLFYSKDECLVLHDRSILSDVIMRDNAEAQKTVDRYLNIDVQGFMYPTKFSLKYNPKDCINSNNDLQQL